MRLLPLTVTCVDTMRLRKFPEETHDPSVRPEALTFQECISWSDDFSRMHIMEQTSVGGSLGPSGSIWRHQGAIWRHRAVSGRYLEGMWQASGRHLVHSWAHFGPCLANIGIRRAAPVAPFGHTGIRRAAHVAPCGTLWAHLADHFCHLGKGSPKGSKKPRLLAHFLTFF